MGILILISGSNNSGKSLYAEQLITRMGDERYYIATMLPSTDDNHRRIEKHQTQRQGLGFQTLECPYRVENAPVSPDSVVLLEDVSNLLANAIFEKGSNADSVFTDICCLLDCCRVLVAVTISGLTEYGYDTETAAYIRGLNKINQKLFERAAVAIELQDKVPVNQKGDVHDLV